MNCGFDNELLSMYADHALKRVDALQVETHISECEECRDALEEIQEIGKSIHFLPRENAPHSLIERIIAEAGGKVNRTAWNAVKWSLIAVWTVAMNGFRIEDDREELLR